MAPPYRQKRCIQCCLSSCDTPCTHCLCTGCPSCSATSSVLSTPTICGQRRERNGNRIFCQKCRIALIRARGIITIADQPMTVLTADDRSPTSVADARCEAHGRRSTHGSQVMLPQAPSNAQNSGELPVCSDWFEQRPHWRATHESNHQDHAKQPDGAAGAKGAGQEQNTAMREADAASYGAAQGAVVSRTTLRDNGLLTVL